MAGLLKVSSNAPWENRLKQLGSGNGSGHGFDYSDKLELGSAVRSGVQRGVRSRCRDCGCSEWASLGGD